MTEHATKIAPDLAWPHYERAVALQHFGRIDAAVSEYRAAAARFHLDGDRWGQSIAIYGAARAFEQVGRCDEAKAAYDEFGAFVRGSDARAAEMATSYANACQPLETPEADPAMTEVVADLVTRDYAGALAASSRVVRGRESGWLDYERAAALAGLGRTDEAVVAYRVAERRLTGDRRAVSLTVYGRARALDDAGRCAEASRAYDDYAALVRPTEPGDADMALAMGRACTARVERR